MKGEIRKGRQKKILEDYIREWTGLEFVKSRRAKENRKKWRKLVVKSSVLLCDPRGKGIDDDDDYFFRVGGNEVE